MSRVSLRVRVTGRVQGVFYRAWTQQQAGRLGVSGWVRNASDGSVEAHLEGDKATVAALIERMRSGPAGAKVTALSMDDAEPIGVSGFEVRH